MAVTVNTAVLPEQEDTFTGGAVIFVERLIGMLTRAVRSEDATLSKTGLTVPVPALAPAVYIAVAVPEA